MKHINYHINDNGSILITWFENEDTPDEYLAHRQYYYYNLVEALRKWKEEFSPNERFQAHAC